jgi:hypothetical protein
LRYLVHLALANLSRPIWRLRTNQTKPSALKGICEDTSTTPQAALLVRAPGSPMVVRIGAKMRKQG